MKKKMKKFLPWVVGALIGMILMRQDGVKKAIAKIPVVGKLLTGLNPDGTPAQ